MGIDIADVFAMQRLVSGEGQNFVALCDRSRRQVLQQFEDGGSIGQTAASHLTDHEGMHDDLRPLQQADPLRVAVAQVVNPQGRGGLDQAAFPCRLRGAAFSLGCDPPSRARRLALSRSISAFKPSASIAERSIGPASLAAFASRASSMLTVVRMVWLSVTVTEYGING